MNLTVCLVGLVTVFAGGLGGVAARAQEGTSHPDPRYADRTSAPTTIVRLADTTRRATRIRFEAARATVGTEDGPDHSVFARIDHAVLLDDSTFAAIEPSLREVRFFRTDGRYVQTLGRRGRGPGEFVEPTAITRWHTGELLVADASRQILVFSPADGQYRYSRAIPTPTIVRAMCVLGSDLYVNAPTPDDPSTIRRIDAAGSIQESFGVLYRSPNSLVNYQSAGGRLACDNQRNLIYLQAGSGSGEVRAYRPGGELVWRVTSENFHTNRVFDTAGGSRMEFGAQGAHGLGEMRLLDANVLLVQWKYRSHAALMARLGDFETVSVEIDLETRNGTAIGSSLPLVLDVREGVALAATIDPFPRLSVHRARVARGAGAP